MSAANCQKCGSVRILSTNSYGRDCQNYSLEGQSIEADYAPIIPEICGGDSLFPDICMDCGQCQGTFPKETPEELLPSGGDE